MNINNGGLGFAQTLNNEDFKRKLKESMQEVNNFSTKSYASMDHLQIKAKDLALTVGGIFTVGAATSFIQEMVKVRGEFEQTEIAFKTMLQSQDKSTKLMAEMVELAKNTPMQFSEVSQGAKQLLAYQVEAEKLTETLTMLGNISSGLSVPISRLILVYGQVRAKGKLMGDDLRQFTEAGVPMIAAIAKNMGVAQSAVAEMVSEGKVGFKDVEKVLQDLTSQGGLFFNMMEEQSKTIPGQIAKLQDEIEQMFNSLGKDAQPAITALISGASTVVENYKEIGSALIDLIAVYGSYKTAVIAVSLIESARAKTVASELGALSFKDKLQLARLNRKKQEALQNLALAKSESVNQQAILATMRTEIASTNIKRQKAIATATEIRNNVAEAQSKLANARAELTAMQSTGTARQISIAQKKVERTENALIAVQEKQSIAIKNKLAQTSAYYSSIAQVENQAKKTKIAQNNITIAQENVEIATKNLNATATARLTLMQNYQMIKTKGLAAAQALLNATMLSNPIIAITAAVLALVYAYNKLATEMSSTEKAQKTLTDLNLEAEKSIVKEKLALEELIKTAKDDKKSKEEREEAIKNLNKISPEHLGNLNLENINTQAATKATDAYTESLFKNARAMAYRSKLEELYKQEIEQQDAMKNGPDRDVFNKVTDKGFNTLYKLLGFNVKDIKNETDVARAVVDKFGKDIKKDQARFNVEYQKALKFYGFTDLLDTKHQIQAIKKEIEKDSLSVKETLNATEQDIAKTTESVKKGSKTKTSSTKKADDPIEIFKKEINQYKDQYDNLQKYLDTKDEGLTTAGEALRITLASKGQTYLEFLKAQQKQLMEGAKTSELAKKKLDVINAEIYPLLNESLFNDFKINFDKQLNDAEYLIDKIKLINEEKAKLEGSTDQGSIDKMKFLNEKDNQNQLNVETYLKEEGEKFDQQYQYLKTMREEYDADMLLLQDRYNKSSNDAEKQRIQGLMALRASKYFEDTNGKFDSVEVNEILKEFKTLEQKKLDIASLYDGKKAKLRAEMSSNSTEDELKLLNDAIAEIERKQTEALKALDLELLKSSKRWVAIFADYSNKSVKEIKTIIKDIENVLSDPPKNLTSTEIKDLQDRLTELKKVLNRDDPFNQLGDSVKKLAKNFRLANGDINFEGINEVIANVKNALNEAISMAEGLGINVSESAKSAIQLGTELFEAGSKLAEGIASKDPIKIVQGVVKGITAIINAGDRKKERQIQQYKEAINQLTKAFQELEYASSKALGGDVYKNQKQMIDNLNQQNAEIDKMIKKENDKKKTDKSKIDEWEQLKLDNIRKSKEIMENISQDILQTNAKDLANTLGDALVEAFGKGEDAAKSFEKVANNILKNAILNQLKKRFLEQALQPILDDLEAQMGVSENGWSGLTPEQQQELRDRIKAVSENFTGALEAYSDLFKDIIDPNQDSLSGAVKGVSEETASLIAGQMNAIRIMQMESLEVHRNSNAILVQQLDQLFRIEFNTRNIVPELREIKTALTTNSTRAWGI